MSSGDVSAYLAAQPDNIRAILEEIRQIIKEAVPEAEEVVSYQMPAFRYHGMLAWYAGFKIHYSIFVPQVLSYFKDELKEYQLSKSGIRIPMDQPVPAQLIRKIVQFAAEQNLAKALTKGKKNSKR